MKQSKQQSESLKASKTPHGKRIAAFNHDGQRHFRDMLQSKVTVKQVSDSPASKEFTRKQFTATFDTTTLGHTKRSSSIRSVELTTAFETASLRKISGALFGGYH